MYLTSVQAIAKIKSGSNLFIQTAAAAPQQLIRVLTARSADLRNVTIYQMHTEGEAPYAAGGMEDAFRVKCLQLHMGFGFMALFDYVHVATRTTR